MMKSFKNFEEFEGEVIKYSDYISDKVDPDDLTDSLNNIPVENTPNKSWSVEDSQQLSAQMTGVRHPWTREQYNKFTHPDVKRDISYEDYVEMWNMKAPDDQKVILEHSPGRGFDVERFPTKETPKAKKAKKPTKIYETKNSSIGYSNSGGTYGTSGGNKILMYDSSSGREFYYDPDSYKKTFVETNKTTSKTNKTPADGNEQKKSGWSLMKLESRIMIIFMIISAILSFITVLILMLK